MRVAKSEGCQSLLALPLLSNTHSHFTLPHQDVAITLEAMRVAKAEGCTVILNTAPALAAASLPKELFALCDILCPNEPELELLSGMSTTSMDEVVAAATHMIGVCGVEHVLVTLGERGCLLVSPKEDGDGVDVHHQNLVTKVDVVDSVGAGDCFLGAFAYYLSCGVALHAAMKLAVEVASISVTAKGTQMSYPSRDALPEHLRVEPN
jgi:ribokinase